MTLYQAAKLVGIVSLLCMLAFAVSPTYAQKPHFRRPAAPARRPAAAARLRTPAAKKHAKTPVVRIGRAYRSPVVKIGTAYRTERRGRP